jgi:hypothetical protein
MALGSLTLGVALGLVVVHTSLAADKADKKDTIKDIMKKAHKGDLPIYKKVQSGKANDAEKAQLLALYQGMENTTPPKGDKADWDKRVHALVKAAEAVKNNDPQGSDMLKAAANCKGCHNAHKGD